jgi:hypothetical protein
MIMPVMGVEGPNQAPSLTVNSNLACQGSTVQINYTAGASNYSFSDIAGVLQTGLDSTFSFVANSSTTIFTEVLGVCTVRDTIQITVLPSPTANLLVQNPIACAGDTITMSVDTGFANVTWSTGSTGSSAFATAAGSYSVTVTDNNGCVASDTAAVSFLPAPVPVVTQSGNMMSTTTNYTSYQWLLNGSPVSGETSPDILTSTSGSYTVMVTDSSGCVGESGPFVFVGIEVGQLQAFSVSPNPFQSGIQLQAALQSPGKVELQVTDLAGRMVFHAQYEASGTQFSLQIELAKLAAGAYLVRLKTEDGIGVAKVLKQ